MRRWGDAARGPLFDLGLLGGLLLVGLLLAQWAYRPVRAAAFHVDAPPVMLPLEDFHAVERFPPAAAGADAPGLYRWTRGTSTAQLPNPGGVALVELELAGGAGRTVPITLGVGAARLSFVIEPELRTYRLLQPMPPGERVALELAAPTFAARNRTLGVVVHRLEISGGGAAPGLVLLALALATVCGYLLVRQGGYSPIGTASALLVVLCLALAWQQAGGWMYALLGPLLLLASVASLGALLAVRWPGLQPPERAPTVEPLRQPGPLEHADHWLMIGVLLLALALRLPLFDAPDPVGDLELAARRMGFLFHDGLAGAYVYDGDYVPFRLYMLQGLGQLVALFGGSFHEPLPFVTKFFVKLPGLLADLTTIGIIYFWSLRWLPPLRATALAALYACAPPVWINVAWWGQVDALLLLPLVAMVLLLDRAGGRWAWLCWATALLIKPQAIVLAPLLYVATVRRHGCRGLAQGGALAVGLIGLACVPLALAGQGPGLAQAYLGSVGRFPMLTAGAYNLWYLLTLGASGPDVGQGIVLAGVGLVSLRMIGLLLVAGVALLVGGALLGRTDGPLRAQGAAVLALAFFCLPTQIHERYLFLTLAFLTLRVASRPVLALPLALLILSATFNILGDLDGFVPLATRLLEGSPVPFVLTVANLGIFGGLLVHLLRSSWARGAER